MNSYYTTPTIKQHNIILYYNNRVLQITEQGYLQMVTDEQHNATPLQLKEYINHDCMRRSLSLSYNNIPIAFNYPIKNTDVKIISTENTNEESIKPYIIEKNYDNKIHFAILDNTFASFALDDYNRTNSSNGSIKWWDLDSINNNKKTPKPNQLFTVKYL